MALTTVNIKTTFDFTASPKVFIFEDITDYAGQSIPLTNVVGVLKITAPSGVVIYNNTNFASPDIDPNVSLINNSIQLPLLGDGTVQLGNYTVEYTVQVSATTLDPAYNVSVIKTRNVNYSAPSASLEISANLVAPLMTSTDTTNYTLNTNYGSVNPTITRVHTLYYPGSTGASPVIGTGQTLTTSTIYTSTNTLQYSSTCVADVSYNLGNDFYAIDEITGQAYYDLASSPTLCEVYCGIRTLYNNWQDKKGTVSGDNYKRKFDAVMDIAQLMAIAIDCGKADDIAGYAAQIKQIGNFQDGCGCSNGTPQLVTGLGTGGTVVVQAGNGVSVATSTSGSTTYYTVSINSTYLDKLNGLFNTYVQAGTGINVSSSVDLDGNITYTISNPSAGANILSQEFTITNSAGSQPNIVSGFYLNYGTKFQAATLSNDNDSLLTDWQNLNNSFTVDDFFTGASGNYTVKMEIVEVDNGSGSPVVDQSKEVYTYVYDKNAADFKIQFVSHLGAGYTGNGLTAKATTIKLNVTLIG